MSKTRIGIIGGTGLYEIDGIEDLHEERVETPFGDPSDAFLVGKLDGVEAVFLSRHGRGHRFSPSEVPYRANIFGMKKLGVEWIISISAVGSLKEIVVPGHVILVDQFIDRTRGRPSTFFGNGIVAHAAFGEPVCEALRGMLLDAAREAGAVVHDGGTYVCMEGPAFSTKAESHLYRSWGATVVGMTNVPECKLAREAEISYATMAMATDYDCWHPEHDQVTLDKIIETLQANANLAKQIIKIVMPRVAAYGGPPPYANAMANSIITSPDVIPRERILELGPIVGKYLG